MQPPKFSKVYSKNLFALRAGAEMFINRGGTRCLIGSTLIKTVKGYKPIYAIKKGDSIYSYNHKNNCIEVKKVINIFKYDPPYNKKLVSLSINNTQIISTYDHKLYTNENGYIKAGIIAKRNTEGLRQSLCSIKSWSDNGILQQVKWQDESQNNESGFGWLRIFKNCLVWKNNKSTSNSSGSFYRKQRKQTDYKPYKRNKNRQSYSEFRMEYTFGKLFAFIQNWITIKKEWGVKWNGKNNGRNSKRNKSQIQTFSVWSKKISARIWIKRTSHKRYCNKKNLEACSINEVKYIELNESVYDIEVENNHNYFITTNDILSHNSGKSYSILQLLLNIGIQNKNTISIVSRTLPHLRIGLMRDFDLILHSYGIIPEKIKNISESTYTLPNGTIIEFFGVDNLAKVHGPQRDILFVNECNHIKSYDIIRHLLVRTAKLKFFDYNPARHFWIDDEIIAKRDCTIIDSTYLDNLDNLTDAQIKEIESNKSNSAWWRVYGEGLKGQLEDTILTYEIGDFDNTFPFIFGLDFGVRDPDALVKVAIDRNRRIIYLAEQIYNNGLSTHELGNLVKNKVGTGLITADSAGARTILDLKKYGLNIHPVVKSPVVDGLKLMQGYKIIVTPESHNLIKELDNYVWMDKKSETPIDIDNHLIDAARYGVITILKTSQKVTTKLIRT